MQLVTHTTPKLLIADEGKLLREKNDVYTPATYNEDGSIFEEEHRPYYASVIFVAKQIDTLEKAQELYVEETSLQNNENMI